MIFGKKIKELREERGLLQRQLSAALEIDTPMYSKIERGERKAKRSQIPIMAKLFDVEEKELLTIWLADKVLDTVEDASEVKNDAIAYVQNEIENGLCRRTNVLCNTVILIYSRLLLKVRGQR